MKSILFINEFAYFIGFVKKESKYFLYKINETPFVYNKKDLRGFFYDLFNTRINDCPNTFQ